MNFDILKFCVSSFNWKMILSIHKNDKYDA